jgi:hypothetical protein
MENMCGTALLMTGPVPFSLFLLNLGFFSRGGVWEKSQNTSIPTQNLHFQYYKNNKQLKKISRALNSCSILQSIY